MCAYTPVADVQYIEVYDFQYSGLAFVLSCEGELLQSQPVQ